MVCCADIGPRETVLRGRSQERCERTVDAVPIFIGSMIARNPLVGTANGRRPGYGPSLSGEQKPGGESGHRLAFEGVSSTSRTSSGTYTVRRRGSVYRLTGALDSLGR